MVDEIVGESVPGVDRSAGPGRDALGVGAAASPDPLAVSPDWRSHVVRLRHPIDDTPVYSVVGVRSPRGVPPIILLHGIGNDGGVFGPVLPAIASLGPVVAPRLTPGLLADPGEQRTSAVPDLIEWLSALAPPPWRLVGHSMGGLMTGLVLRSRPELVTQAVLLNSPLPGVVGRLTSGDSLDRTGRALLMLKALAQITVLGRPRLPGLLRGTERLVVRNALRGFVRDPGALPDDFVSDAIMATRTTDGNDFLRLARNLPPWFLEPHARRPVTLVLGDSDPLVPPREYETVCAAYPDAEVHIADHCGHFVHLERPDLTIHMIAAAFGAADGMATTA